MSLYCYQKHWTWKDYAELALSFVLWAGILALACGVMWVINIINN